MSAYAKDPVTNREIYNVDASGREYTVNGVYAKDENGNEYYPTYSPGKLLVLRDKYRPIFIPNVADVSFVNIEGNMDINRVQYYIVRPGHVGQVYLFVMQHVVSNNLMYDAWKAAGLSTEPFKYFRTYSRFRDIEVYHRGGGDDDYFVFEGDREVTVIFDANDRLHKLKEPGVYYEEGMTYHLENGIRKKYFEQQRGIIANRPDKVYYTPYPATAPTVIIENELFTVGEFGQDVDRNGDLFNYTADYNFVYENGAILRFQFGYRWNARYYEDANGDYPGLPDYEPANVDPNAAYVKDQTGRELYPKFKGNEYCHANREYARNADGSFYYPQLADGRLLVLMMKTSGIIPIPDLIPGGGVAASDLDQDLYPFVQRRYFVTKDPMPPQRPVVSNKTVQPPVQPPVSNQPPVQPSPPVSSQPVQPPPPVSNQPVQIHVQPPPVSNQPAQLPVSPPVQIPAQLPFPVQPPTVSIQPPPVQQPPVQLPFDNKIQIKDFSYFKTNWPVYLGFVMLFIVILILIFF